MTELVVAGFSDQHRAEEVLAQLRRLEFGWVADLENAVAVEVDAQGRLNVHYSLVLDPAFADSAPAWRALLVAIQPPGVPRRSASRESGSESRAVNAEASVWRRELMANPPFLRDLSAVLRPGDSAIFTVLGEADPAVRVLRGYSSVLLRTPLTEAQARKLRTARNSSNWSPRRGPMTARESELMEDV